MKQLINNIKYNRIPKEVLNILYLLENPPEIFHFHDFIDFRTKHTNYTLFTIHKKEKTLFYYKTNILSSISEIRKVSVKMYIGDQIDEYIKQAIGMSKYADYKIR